MELPGKRYCRRVSAISLIFLSLFFSGLAIGEDTPAPNKDPHHTEAGFFDMHVCNWPDRPQFFMALLSTTRFKEVAGVEVFRPDNRPLGKLNMQHFRVVKTDGKPDKEVFITQFPTEPTDKDGWYSATVTLKDGRQFGAKDFVNIKSLPYVNLSTITPADGAENIALPHELSWEPVAGAKFYQVFITDLWNDGQLIYTSDFLNEPRLDLPKDLIKPGGMYSWRVHSRDLNGNDDVLGDFNSGSLGLEAKFTVE